MGEASIDDRELLGRIAAGDDDAFGVFYVGYQTPGTRSRGRLVGRYDFTVR
jgi:hypothetical protein